MRGSEVRVLSPAPSFAGFGDSQPGDPAGCGAIPVQRHRTSVPELRLSPLVALAAAPPRDGYASSIKPGCVSSPGTPEKQRLAASLSIEPHWIDHQGTRRLDSSSRLATREVLESSDERVSGREFREATEIAIRGQQLVSAVAQAQCGDSRVRSNATARSMTRALANTSHPRRAG
jgi:hypothetical protein